VLSAVDKSQQTGQAVDWLCVTVACIATVNTHVISSIKFTSSSVPARSSLKPSARPVLVTYFCHDETYYVYIASPKLHFCPPSKVGRKPYGCPQCAASDSILVCGNTSHLTWQCLFYHLLLYMSVGGQHRRCQRHLSYRESSKLLRSRNMAVCVHQP